MDEEYRFAVRNSLTLQVARDWHTKRCQNPTTTACTTGLASEHGEHFFKPLSAIIHRHVISILLRANCSRRHRHYELAWSKPLCVISIRGDVDPCLPITPSSTFEGFLSKSFPCALSLSFDIVSVFFPARSAAGSLRSENVNAARRAAKAGLQMIARRSRGVAGCRPLCIWKRNLENRDLCSRQN